MKLNHFVQLLGLALLGSIMTVGAADKKLVLIAGKISHGPGEHEFRAGCLPGLATVVFSNGWPQEASAFEGADGVFIYSDGGGGNPALQGDHARILGELTKKGVGLGFGHYGVEVPKDKGGQLFQDWIGGYYEDHFSCNPMWAPDYQTFPDHPINRGIKPFSLKDEWYFNMNFRPNMQGVTPLLVAKPSDKVRDGPYVWPAGPYPHIQANKGRDEVMMWCVERPDGGRGVGWTGGHYHKNWGNESYRKVVLNALVWLVKMEVPAGGVSCPVSDDDLKLNLDPKGKK
ncbi:MAG: ThuA domain-containing protein [Verrucomicrobia bacterium]|nr:ThuA domain-containing protein [Verrucomicrobiota bacterium]